MAQALVCFLLFSGYVAGNGEIYDYNYYEEEEPDLPQGFLADLEGEDVLLTTHSGDLLGKRQTSQYDTGGITRTIDSYLGVPYARPPIEDLRFQRPRTLFPWSGVRPARRFSSVCPQEPQYSYTQTRFQDEDCLYLNIYVPFEEEDPSQTYPILVYLHGGSYAYGAGTFYPGQLLAQHGAIVITINYRLGLLGFWSARSSDLTGNYGLWDQIQALKWIKHNAETFRGDADRVTIFGNSAGGASVGFLILSPHARGLFRSAIAQSGTPFTFWSIHNNTVDLSRHARSVAKLYGCHDGGIASNVECMKALPWQDIMAKIGRIPSISPSGVSFRPCVDGDLIPNLPRETGVSSYVNPITVMVGTVKDEWTRNLGWFIEDLLQERTELDGDYGNGINRVSFLTAIEHVVTRRFGWHPALAKLIQNEYTNWTHVEDPIENRNQYVHFFTDLSMLVPSVEMARWLVRRHVPVYQYTFNHHSSSTQPSWFGSYHEVELNFIFGSPYVGLNVDEAGRQNYTDEDRRVSSDMMKLWTNFAKYNDPTPRPLPNTDARWRQFVPVTSDYMYIHANHTHMAQYLRADKVAFWTALVPEMKRSFVILPPEERSFRPEMFVFVGISIALLVLLLIALYVVVRKSRGIPGSSDRPNGRMVRV